MAKVPSDDVSRPLSPVDRVVPGGSSSGSDESKHFSGIKIVYENKPCPGGTPIGSDVFYDCDFVDTLDFSGPPCTKSELARARARMKEFNASLAKKYPNFKPKFPRKLEPHQAGPKLWEIPREEVEKFVVPLATEALKSYNKNSGTNYELLVDSGYCSSSLIPEGIVYHMNFKARMPMNIDKPDTPLMMFFAEVLEGKNLKVELCECLGPTESLPGKPRNRGCTTCNRGIIHHPYRVTVANSGLAGPPSRI